MSTLAEFIKWGQYKSTDQYNPDVLELKVVNVDPFETVYSINVEVLQKVDEEWVEKILPLKSHESPNASLLNQWTKEIRNNKNKPRKIFQIKTWLGKSRNDRPIRRFSLEV